MTDSDIALRWLGINALEFRYPGGSCLIDPYVSRDPHRLTIPGEVARYITRRPDFVLMTHAHWDHLPDMPEIIRRTGTVLYASKTACNLMRACAVPEAHLHEIHPGERLEFPGGVRVTVLESKHMEPVLHSGFYDRVPERVSDKADWLCGEVFAFLIEWDRLRILNAGSANLHLPAVDGLECDCFICGISRWKPGFPELLRHIRFRTLIPVHHDEFTLPLDCFRLRDDFARLRQAWPELRGRELPVLQFTALQPS